MYSNYPPGAEHDPSAPYNEVEIPPREYNVKVAQTLEKKTSVETCDYTIECEPDFQGIFLDDVDWYREYREQHKTPLELINILKQELENKLKTLTRMSEIAETQWLISECEGWSDDLEVYPID